MKIAFQMDDPAGFNRATDSTMCLIYEAAARGHEIFYYDAKMLTHRADGRVGTPLAAMHVQAGEVWFQLSPAVWTDLSSMDVVWVRQDPPFDMAYMTATYLLGMLPAHVRVFNRPQALRDHAEKLSPLQFLEWMPPTLISADMQEIEVFFETHKAVVLKPLYSFGGRGIVLVESAEALHKEAKEILENQPNIPLVAQTFIPEVRTRELRVLLVNGEVEGAFARIPQGDDIRSNLRLGGRAELIALNPRERAVCAALKDWLQAEGLLFVGLDLIGGYLNEINITSPTGLKTYEDLTGVSVAAKIWDVIERQA